MELAIFTSINSTERTWESPFMSHGRMILKKQRMKQLGSRNRKGMLKENAVMEFAGLLKRKRESALRIALEKQRGRALAGQCRGSAVMECAVRLKKKREYALKTADSLGE